MNRKKETTKHASECTIEIDKDYSSKLQNSSSPSRDQEDSYDSMLCIEEHLSDFEEQLKQSRKVEIQRKAQVIFRLANRKKELGKLNEGFLIYFCLHLHLQNQLVKSCAPGTLNKHAFYFKMINTLTTFLLSTKQILKEVKSISRI